MQAPAPGQQVFSAAFAARVEAAYEDDGRIARELHDVLAHHIALERSGQPESLPPVADMTAYRIIQEALTTTRKHVGPVSRAGPAALPHRCRADNR